MSENTLLRVVRHTDFKKTVETALGHSIRQEDVSVISTQDKKLSERVAALDLTEIINKMVSARGGNNIKPEDVAVITQEDLFAQDVVDNVAPVTGSKLKLGK